MNIKSIIIVGLLVIISGSVYSDELVISKEYQFTVTYPDGDKERTIASYWGKVADKRWQKGHTASLKKLHARDTRRGHQELTTYIERRVSLIARTGQRYDDKSMTRVFHVSSAVKGGWDSGHISKIIGKHKPLSACRAEFDQNKRAAIQFLKTKFDTIVKKDLEQLRK